MDQLSLLNTFVRVTERGSFSAVARDFNTSQPVISRQVATLEDQLGVRLIQRTTRRLSLTEDGQIYLEHARAVVEAMDAAQASVGIARRIPTGQVRVGVPTSVGMYLAARLPEFFARYPEMSLDLKMRDGAFDLVEEGLDLVISIAEATQTSVITRTIGSAASVLVAIVPDNMTLIPLPPYAPELNPMENVWDYLRGNKLSSLVWNSYQDMGNAAKNAWNFLVSDPAKITSIGTRDWAQVTR